MKILITGGAGYIGSVLVPCLLDEGHHVTVIDNFMYGQNSLLNSCLSPNFRIIRGDVRDNDLILDELKLADAILPLACLTGAPICERDPIGAKQINFDSIRFIVDHKSKDQYLVYPSTNSGYGIGNEDIHCDESSPLRPISLYGKLKVELENYILERGDCITFRFATVFGVSPRMRLDLLVNDFTYRAVFDKSLVLFEPHFKRNYLHVRDASQAFSHALQNYRTMVGEPYNIGLSEANLSKEQLCIAIKHHVDDFRFVVSHFGTDPDQRNYIVSNAKIESTGFQTCVSLDQGIQELIKGFQIICKNQHSNS